MSVHVCCKGSELTWLKRDRVDVTVVTVDFFPIQPQECVYGTRHKRRRRMLTTCRIPRNMKIILFDLETPVWEELTRECDLIHVQMLLGSIATPFWETFYKNTFE